MRYHQRVPGACRSGGWYRPSHLLGDLLAGVAQRVFLGVSARHPDLAAQGPDRGAHHYAFDNRRAGGDELAIVCRHALQHDMSHALVVAVKKRLRRSNGSFAYSAHPTKGSSRGGDEQ